MRRVPLVKVALAVDIVRLVDAVVTFDLPTLTDAVLAPVPDVVVPDIDDV
jgi:hypothetical protein